MKTGWRIGNDGIYEFESFDDFDFQDRPEVYVHTKKEAIKVFSDKILNQIMNLEKMIEDLKNKECIIVSLENK